MSEEKPGHERDTISDGFKAVRQAQINRHPRIIHANIDEEYRKATQKNSPNFYANQISETFRGSSTGMVKKFGPRSASAFGIDRVFDVPHNPFRNRLAIETPQNIVELYQRFRYYAQREPLVGIAIELHSEFPLSSFQVEHEDSALQEFFNDMIEKLKLFDFLLDMAYEYWCIGECFPMGIFDDPKDPMEWNAFILLNPLNVDIESVPITDGRPNTQMRLRLDNKIKMIVANGSDNKLTGDLYNRLPADVIDACKQKDGFLPLNPIQASHFKRKSNYFKVRGESMLYRILHLLSYRDKLRDAMYSLADRQVTPREIYKVGEPNNPASPDELQALADMISQSYLDPTQAIVWHHALQVDVIGGFEKALPVRQELDGIESEMLTGLMLNKGFLDSSYGAYANMSVALDVLICRYLTFRQRIEDWLKDHVFAPICRIHNIYKPTNAELAHRIRTKKPTQRPWVPKIMWDKHELKDNNQKVQLLLSLRDKLGKPGFPRDIILKTLNYNPRTIKKSIDREVKEDLISGNKINLQGAPGGAPGAPGGGLPDMGGMPLDNLNAPIGEVPGGGSASPASGKPSDKNLGGGVNVQPPGGGNVQNFGTGNPGAPGG